MSGRRDALTFTQRPAQAQNFVAERQAAEVRIRAERRAGELLREMKENGQRDSGGRGRIESRGTTQLKNPPRLQDLGITKDQSSKWQQLAAVPDEEFERAVRGDGPKPTTEVVRALTCCLHTGLPYQDRLPRPELGQCGC